MAGFQKIDKSQVPQVIGLGVLSVGMFGYFAYKMITPTASAAPTVKATVAAPTAGQAAGATGGTDPASSAPAQATTDAPPPTPGMRDPFVAAISADPTPAPAIIPAKPSVQVALQSAPGSDTSLHVPFAPALPPGGGQMPRVSPLGMSVPTGLSPMPVMPAALSAPAWTVTGVLQSDTGNIAILRDGDVRKFAHRGDLVGGTFRVVDVTRQFIVMQHGSHHYILPLGGPKKDTSKETSPLVSTPSGTTPPGTTPSGTTPSAMTPAGSTTNETVPSALSPVGVLPQTPGALPTGAASTALNTLQQLAGKQ